jgi:hypothetical protein
MKTFARKALLVACVAVFGMAGWVPSGRADCQGPSASDGSPDIRTATDNCTCTTSTSSFSCDRALSCRGGAGNDTIKCEDPNGCVMESLGGRDTIIGSDGDDTICTGSGNDKVYPGGGSNVVHAGSGHDEVTGVIGAEIGLNQVNKIYGDSGDNTLKGTNGIDWIYGKGGKDKLKGYGANDQLNGGADNDTLDGGAHQGGAGDICNQGPGEPNPDPTPPRNCNP